jgi:hypothetical protein
MERVTLSPAEVASLVEMDRATLEAWIRQDTCPFGEYIKKEGNRKGCYKIFKARFEAYMSAQDMLPVRMV